MLQKVYDFYKTVISVHFKLVPETIFSRTVLIRIFPDFLQHGGTNFTAFRIIDTSKPEVKAVIHDIVNKEIAQGRMIEMQVSRWIRTLNLYLMVYTGMSFC